jgi:dephospho-CoA kinase
MAIIGITGSIASGKTALLKYLASLSHPIFSCDIYVKKLYQDPSILQQISYAFPELRTLDKLALAKIIYSDKASRTKLEAIIHPLVAQELEKFLDSRASQLKAGMIIFLEIPLLFEAGWEKYCTHIITLCCPVEVRMQRALDRGLSKEMFQSIDNAQIPEELKRQKSDFAMNTNVSWVEEIAEFQSIMKRIS